jgi:hypothetical protein
VLGRSIYDPVFFVVVAGAFALLWLYQTTEELPERQRALLGVPAATVALVMLVRAFRVAVLTDGNRVRIRNLRRTVTLDWDEVTGLDVVTMPGPMSATACYRVLHRGRPVLVRGADASFRAGDHGSLGDRPLPREVRRRRCRADGW